MSSVSSLETCQRPRYDRAVSAINFHTKEISVKIVYYGPGLCGKTTSLQTIFNSLPPERRPDLVSLATEVDRTIFFDFLPVTAYRIKDFTVRLQLYTVPGQVFYNGTRKLVLNGVDGLIMVLDSQAPMRDSNGESMQNLRDNLSELGLELERVPMVFQYNKRDIREIMPVQEMDALYNNAGWQRFESVATTGQGVFDALKAISRMVVNDLMRKGLGRQLRDGDDPASRAASSVPPSSASGDGFASVGEAVNRVTTGAAQPPGVGAAPLWPMGVSATLGKNIDEARNEGNWSGLVLAVEAMLQHEAQRWVNSAGDKYRGVDPVGTFLLVRGTSGARFSNFLRSVKSAKNGKAVSHSEAMSALILALESVW